MEQRLAAGIVRQIVRGSWVEMEFSSLCGRKATHIISEGRFPDVLVERRTNLLNDYGAEKTKHLSFCLSVYLSVSLYMYRMCSCVSRSHSMTVCSNCVIIYLVCILII